MRAVRLAGGVVAVLVLGCVGPPGPQGEPGPRGPAGAGYVRTVLVSPSGTEVQNGAALMAALGQITDASSNSPYLLELEPGIYDLTGNGSGALFMKDGVDIEGSGELTTVIKTTAQTTILAANAELRFLTVANSGSGTFQTAVATYATVHGFHMTHVTAVTTSNGGMFAYAFSGNGVLSDCTLQAGGASDTSSAVFANTAGEVTVTDSVLAGTTHGIQLQSGVGHVAGSQVIGGGIGATCAYCYDRNFQPLNNTCN